MKWIRWDNASHFELSDEIPKGRAYDDFIHHSHIVCEKDTNWREIESGTLDLDDGKLHITLKPLPTPEKVLMLVEAAKRYLEAGCRVCQSHKLLGLPALESRTEMLNCAIQLAEAIEREEKKPANPYTKEAVDEALNALDDGGYEFAKQNPIPDQSMSEKYKRIYNAFQALLRQKEAANVT